MIRLVASFVFLLLPLQAMAWKQNFTQALKNGSAYVETDSGQVLFDHRSQEPFIPASTLKIAMAACAIEPLGLDYRFPTDFWLTSDNELIIKGYGDPFLVSEEIQVIAEQLAKKGLRRLNGIILNTEYFEDNPRVDGRSSSHNPYDALNGPLVANFNTVYFKKGNGKVTSAEPQTPLTPIARQVAKKYPAGKHRVNLGKDPEKSARYFGELLAEFLKSYAVEMPANLPIRLEDTGKQHTPLYRHRSSKTLADVSKGLLEYSTNFMANQLFLVIGAQKYGAPATTEKGKNALTACLRDQIGWTNFAVLEGAGLSRKNQVTARQMMELLRKFQKHQHLLPLEKSHFRAKTGTLTGVNTLAGYFKRDNGELVRFVILVNSPVPFNYKFKLAQKLHNALR